MSTANPKVAINWPHVLVGAAMVIASGLAIAFMPTKHAFPEGAVDLERMIPKQFGRWKQVETGVIQMSLTPQNGEATTPDQPYDQTLLRTYVREDGAVVMLALAYGRSQKQQIKVHRPEVCYAAQGFEVRSPMPVAIRLDNHVEMPAYRLITRNQQRIEPVTYWIRIGDRITSDAWEARMKIFLEGLQGRIPDGLLVRTSQAITQTNASPASFDVQAEFLRDLFQTLDRGGRDLLTGTPT